jgi:hypothetical protein
MSILKLVESIWALNMKSRVRGNEKRIANRGFRMATGCARRSGESA